MKIQLLFILILFVTSCKKDVSIESPSEFGCWIEDYSTSLDTSMYYDGIFRFRIGNSWTYQRTDFGIDSNIIDTFTSKIEEIRYSRNKMYWYGYFGWLRTDGMDIYTTEYAYNGPTATECPTERPFFLNNTPSSFYLQWHHNSPHYIYSFHADTIETISGVYPNYYLVTYFGAPYSYMYFVENIGIVKYQFNPSGYGFEYDLISYDIH